MKKTIKILILTIIMLTAISLATRVNAATASVSASKTNVTVGESVTITVNVNAAAWSVSVGGAISGRMTGYNDDGVNQHASKQFTLNTSTAGTYTVSISGDVTDESSDYSTPVSGSVTVTVNAPAPAENPSGGNNSGNNGGASGGSTTSKPKPNTNTTKPEEKESSNSRLESLQIAEGAISPEFSSSVKEYTISVPNEITKLSIAAVPADSKATTRINGNDELKIGENEIEVIVTAEDGSKTTYVIKAIRAEAELGLQALNVFYLDENGEKIELTLDPIFGIGTLEYTLKDISYKIEKLIVEVVATRENAKIEIMGHEELKTGENIITIKVTSVMEVETEEETTPEEKIYTIKVNKEEEPVVAPLTTKQKIQNWFKGVQEWASKNVNKIMAVLLIISTTLIIGLTIYFAYDYKHYQALLAELARVNKTNLMEKANFALNGEEQTGENKSIIAEQENTENEITSEKVEEVEERSERINEAWDKFVKVDEQGKTKPEKGKRFKK